MNETKRVKLMDQVDQAEDGTIIIPSSGDISLVQTADVQKTLAQAKSKMATQELNHTILVVGWGYDEQKKMPYWIARNSYGDHWGMSGDFHVRMGKNDYGIESELSGYNVVLL